MSNKIRIEVYKRLVLAKVLYKAGETACKSRNDEMVFTKGIMILHDAAEAALGAIADHLHANLTDKHYLLQYYELIKKADPKQRTVPYRTQMRNLNTLRNIAKHQGILPDYKANAHFPSTVYSLIEEICQEYLGLDFSSISLKSLIKNKGALSYINHAEKEIEQGKIESSLISLAYAMYHICETSTLFSFSDFFLLDRKEPKYLFTKPFGIEHTVNLIEHGVDPYLYYRFKNLTPRIFKHKESGDLHYWWDKFFGHPVNWTINNVKFCLNFCIETALKFQREEDEGDKLISYYEAFVDIITPSKEEAIIWNRSSQGGGILFREPSEPRIPLLTLKRGQSIVGYAMDFEHNLDEWFITSKDIPPPIESYEAGFGYVLKNDVKVTPQKSQIPKKVSNSED